MLNYEDQFPDSVVSANVSREIGEIYSVDAVNQTGIIRSFDFSLEQPIDRNNLTQNQETSGGCYILSCQVNSIVANSTGCTFGVVEDLNADLNDLTNWEYAIDMRSSNDLYQTVWGADGVEDYTVNPSVNDLLIFRMNHYGSQTGKFELILFNAANPTGVVLKSITTATDDDLFPVLLFKTQPTNATDKIKLNEVKMAAFKTQSFDFGDLQSRNIQPAEPTVAANLEEFIGAQNFESCNFKLELSETLAQFFGYKSTNLILNNSINFRVDSDFTIQQYEKSEAYIIEMLNIPINSFDGFNKIEQRKNLLYMFQNDRNTTQSDVKFQSPQVQFLEIGNANSLNLRNIQCRILDSEYNKVAAKGNSNITLLIK
jgi:hypothetical protein